MPLDIIVGAQWGDEGKGRITDLLAEHVDVVARYSGGNNAGHTVTIGEKIFKLHQLPSGVLQPNAVSVLGNGMVINPIHLLEEMEHLRELGVDVSPQHIKISSGAHLITPAHIALDKADEAARAGEKIGTTGRGIGPAYTDKTSRRGLRAERLLNAEDLGDKLVEQIKTANTTLEKIYGQAPLNATQIASDYVNAARQIAPYITETSLYLHQQLQRGANVLAEGAQGTLLDIDHGTYPFVTSSSPGAGGVFAGLGVGPKFTNRIIGVTKAFQTRVGSGPFPTEAFGAEAERLRGTGANPWDEFGTTTGRPRRCGWLDLVLLRYAVRVNGLTEIVLTKLDVLSGLETIQLCTGYEADGKTHPELPLGPADLSPFRAVYEPLKGWTEDVSGLRHFTDLPPAAQNYIRRIEELIGVPVSLVSVGPERTQIIKVS